MRSLLVTLAVTLVFNALVAVFLSVIGVGGATLAENLLWSQCIGLSIAVTVLLALRRAGTGPRRIAVAALAVGLGAALGASLASVVSLALWPVAATQAGGSEAVLTAVARHGLLPWQAVFIGLFFGGIASALFWLRERNAVLAATLRERELARLEAEKRSIEAQLRMLQAQIEPHFLFNSLANVAALIEAEPALAGRLLVALIDYLRASLARTRAEHGTLGDEVALLTAYLEVLKIRMGARLEYRFDIPPALAALPLPPMLLQPLVENAVRHGLEPKIEGGRLCIAARREGDLLHLTVDDDGLGFAAAPEGTINGAADGGSGDGVGLANIRARLAALFGPAARLRVTAKVGAGVTASLAIPVAAIPA